MFDPTVMVANCRFGYVVRHEGCDYHVTPPLSVRLNPLRYEIGIGRNRPCAIVLNRRAWLNRMWADLNWRLWKRRYREKFGHPKRRPPHPQPIPERRG